MLLEGRARMVEQLDGPLLNLILLPIAVDAAKRVVVPDVNCSYPLATTRFPHRVDRLIHSLRVEAAPPC